LSADSCADAAYVSLAVSQLIFHALSRQRFASRGLGVLTVAAGGAPNAGALFARLLPACAALAERCARCAAAWQPWQRVR
jgi:hypothetical protein